MEEFPSVINVYLPSAIRSFCRYFFLLYYQKYLVSNNFKDKQKQSKPLSFPYLFSQKTLPNSSYTRLIDDLSLTNMSPSMALTDHILPPTPFPHRRRPTALSLWYILPLSLCLLLFLFFPSSLLLSILFHHLLMFLL